MKDDYFVIGVMSGTSLDGIDLAYIKFSNKTQWNFKILKAETVKYPINWYDTLKGLVNKKINEIEIIDEAYTRYLAQIIKEFIEKYQIKNLNAVCSHGHTALHQPERELTYQIGNNPILAEYLQETVVCDFRAQDVALGGQGAPLVPIGDKLLFSNYDFCLNLGGFANISTNINNERIAFDICPVNIVLNKYVNVLGFDFDNRGKIAASGQIHKELLNQLNALSFYKKEHPKSLGLEWVETHIFPLIDEFKLQVKDVLCTFIEHVAIQIASQINTSDYSTILVTGGGVYNTYLLNRLKAHTQQKIIVPDKDVIEFKEALIFGLLGVLKLRNEVNCLKSVTGALKDHSTGKIFIP
jgi:anhydro-N-acetylmuramic acid kinase